LFISIGSAAELEKLNNKQKLNMIEQAEFDIFPNDLIIIQKIQCAVDQKL